MGIDLASRAPLTAAARIEWTRDGGELTLLNTGLDDAALLAIARDEGVTKVAIDAPFGWPRKFVDAVSRYSRTGRWPAAADGLAYRDTDDYVRLETGQVPLSVAADRIAHTAFRCARLLTRLSSPHPVDRTGDGLAVEVYPAAALRRWGLTHRGYKGRLARNASALRDLVTDLLSTTPWLVVADADRERLERSDHLLDAVVSALVARAVEAQLTDPLPPEHREAAAAEGWIHLPREGSLALVQ